jgi:hypothetical protein
VQLSVPSPVTRRESTLHRGPYKVALALFTRLADASPDSVDHVARKRRPRDEAEVSGVRAMIDLRRLPRRDARQTTQIATASRHGGVALPETTIGGALGSLVDSTSVKTAYHCNRVLGGLSVNCQLSAW